MDESERYGDSLRSLLVGLCGRDLLRSLLAGKNASRFIQTWEVGLCPTSGRATQNFRLAESISAT